MDQNKILTIGSFLVTLIFMILLYVVVVNIQWDQQSILYISIGLICIVITILVVFFLKINKIQNQGFPLEDERSIQIKYKAGYNAFILSWFLWLILMISTGFSGEIKPNWEIYTGLMGMMVAFLVNFFYLNRSEI
ncbi:MAG: hypothetical protein ACXAC7_09020 [Candidatus Hodarchaeales archaeon]|jgi:Na+/proline symporter